VRVHDVILLLDKDNLVPVGISQRALPEFVLHPEIAYLQIASEPSNSDENYFSRIIGYFTWLGFALAFRDAAVHGAMVPLVGHNAYLRKAALKENGWWPEDCACEDFAFAIGALARGWIGKYVQYPDMRFGEDVSNTIFVETAKVSRYAFGALELMLNRPGRWRTTGVFHARWKAFCRSPHVSWGLKADLLCYLLKLSTQGFIFFQFPLVLFNKNYIANMFVPIMMFSGVSTLVVITSNLRGRIEAGKEKGTLGQHVFATLRTAVRHVSYSLVYGMIILGSMYYGLKGTLRFLRHPWETCREGPSAKR
jgi:cellulose synthase/poly-beta-1,6-N-acetylglucosamine synthase-like glycosyltransferase